MLQFELSSITSVQAAGALALSAFTAAAGYFTKLAIDARQKNKDRFDNAVEAKAMRSLISIASGIAEDDLTLDAVRVLLSSNKQALDEVIHYIRTTPKPHLVWIKERVGRSDFRMVQVNNYFAALFLSGSASFYCGKRDNEIFPNDIAAEFAKNDEEAFVTGQTQHVREPVYSPHTGERGVFIGVKWMFQVEQRSYVCGMGKFEPEPISQKFPKE